MQKAKYYTKYPNCYTKYPNCYIKYPTYYVHKIYILYPTCYTKFPILLHKIPKLLLHKIPKLLHKITQISTTQNIQRTVHTIQNGTWLFSHSSYRGILMHWTLDHESINFHTLQCNTQYSIYGHCPGTILTVQLQWNNVYYCGRDAVHFGLKNQHIYYLCTVGFKLNQTELTDYTGMQYLLRITKKGTKIPLF